MTEAIRIIIAIAVALGIGYWWGCSECKTKREEMWEGVDRLHKE